MKILTYTSLFPNAAFPRHGIFVEQRLRHLLQSQQVQSRVVAPVPWFPFQQKWFGSYAQYACVPDQETRHDIQIDHPRYLSIPKIGMNVAPRLLAMGSYPRLQTLRQDYPFQLIDAHYFYPDGVAAAKLAEKMRLPLVITARGTDINLIPQFPGPRRQIQWAAARANAIITVCQALKDALIDLGVAAEKITVLRNGVNLQLFQPLSREATRKALGLNATTLLSVGHLIRRKGHDKVIRSLAAFPELHLLIIGDGEEENNLKRLCHELRLTDRVRFMGHIDQDHLKEYYSAADVLVLASSREGWPNVLLEAMACGTPVVATPVWGSPEVVRKPEAGRVAAENSVDALVAAISDLLANYPDRAMTRQYAELHSWENTTQGQLDIFNSLV